MAPLSILPGRIRFESYLLKGQRALCRFLEQEVAAIEGVFEVEANRRTGRILVKFDEEVLNQDILINRLEKMLATCKECPNLQAEPPGRCGESGEKSEGITSSLPCQLLVDLAVNALMPRPLDLILPAALALLRR
ncbi:MAG: hypothetical protein M1438_05290 [Deltaproteobacteria bacterium]|nr:hypothetical protein [Deltaproteobacteria bacterium]